MAEKHSIVCCVCGEVFHVPKWRAGKAKCCSKNCVAEQNKRVQSIPLADRFWQKVDVRSGDECWNWKGAATRGYGSVKGDSGTNIPAHVAAYHLSFGVDGVKQVSQSCDNTLCCNPSHLVLGTKAQRLKDAERKFGRGKIYALIDPISKRRMYVGSTTQRYLSVRLAQHRLDLDGSPRGNWVSALLAKGLSPEIELLDQVPVESTLKAEAEWIAALLRRGEPLLNMYDPDLSAPRPEESRRKLADFRRRWTGWEHSESTKAKIGRVGEHNRSSKASEDHVREIRRAHSIGEPQRRLAAKYGLSCQAVNDIVHRKTWRHVD